MTEFSSLLASLTDPPTPNQAFNFLQSCCAKKVNIHAYGGDNEGYEKDLVPIACESVDELISAVGSKIRLTASAADTIKIMLATAISLEISGPFIWMHICGPSSGLKTTILELLGAAHDKVFSVSDFTSFYSGSTAGGRDNSLLPKIQGRLFIIKDLTPLLQADKQVQNTVFGQMRTIYDGDGKKWFNNGVNHDYRNVRFVCLTGVTHAIYTFSRTDMGERFLICDINGEWTPGGEYRRMATDMEADGNAYDSIYDVMCEGFAKADEAPKLDLLKEERAMCWGLLNHLLEHMQDEGHDLRTLSRAFRDDRTFKSEVDALAEWLEHARCPKPSKSMSHFRPEPALPHRSVKQLSKIALSLAIITKSTGPTDEIRRLTRKLAFDSGKSMALEIMNIVAASPSVELAILSSKVMHSKPSVNDWCEHLISIGVLETRFKQNGTPHGRHSLCYVLTPKFRMIADIIGLKAATIGRATAEAETNPIKRLFGRIPK